ncbi:MAG: MMPL family transporter [Pirellulaceae bacterium]
MAARVRFGTAYVEAWLPKQATARVEYREFVRDFGADQYLIVSWTGCRLDDRRLSTMAGNLRELQTAEPDLAIVRVFDSRSAVEMLVQQQNDMDPAAAARRLQGTGLGRDGTAFITLQLDDASLVERGRLIAEIEATAADLGITEESLVLAGEPFQVHTIDQSSRETMRYFVAPSSCLALVVAWLCLRSWRLTVLVFAFAGIGQVIGLALIATFLGEMSAVMVVLPTLIFMLTLSAAVHLTNYYRDALGEHAIADGQGAGLRALRLGAWPCALATLTTVFGFGSLIVSQLSPVWQFGCLSALGLLISTSVLLCIFPAATRLPRPFWGSAKLPSLKQFEQHAIVVESEVVSLSTSPWIDRLSQFTQRLAWPISVIGIGLLVVSGIGILRLRTSTEFGDMFLPQHRAMKSLNWVVEKLGPIDSLEVLVTLPQYQQLDLLDRLAAMQQLTREIGELDRVHSTLSATTFLPAIPASSGTRSVIRRAVLRKKLEANYHELTQRGLVAVNGHSETWRVTVRVAGLHGDNYRAIRDALREQTELGLRKSDIPNAIVRIGGLRTVIEAAHTSLLSDLGSSFATAFLLITPVMILIVRSLWGGLVLMLPNLLPVVLVFGTMGWLGIRLDVASILTASVALGIAVDDTLHFLSWFQRSRGAGQTQLEAVRQAMTACAKPMFHTTLICSAAMLPFFFSDFLPTSKFALLMILILSGAIVGDLVLLPALLLSPVGGCLKRHP